LRAKKPFQETEGAFGFIENVGFCFIFIEPVLQERSYIIMLPILNIILSQDVQNVISAENSILYNVFKDFILPIVLAIAAAITAYYIFVIETKRDTIKEGLRKQNEQNDKLFYFSTLVKSVIKSSINQKEHLDDLINKIEKDDLTFHLLTMVPQLDFKRISTELNLEEYLLAYTAHFDSNRKESVKEFKEIIDSVDFLYSIFESYPNQLKLSHKIDLENKTKFQSLFKAAYDKTAILSIILNRTDLKKFNELQIIISNFIKNNNDKQNIKVFMDFFVLPINDFCIDNIDPKKFIINEIQDLAVLTRDCKQVFNDIKANNQTIKDNFASDYIAISNEIKELNKISEKLLENF